ncbi:MAG: type II secretion system F family protein [Kineosporiaceae bacterium]
MTAGAVPAGALLVVSVSVSPGVLAVVGAGALAGLGVVAVVAGLRGTPPRRGADRARVGDALGSLARRVLLAAALGAVVLVLTRWGVAAAATAGAVLMWDRLVGGGAEERRSIDRLDALAAWTESLRDTIAGAVGLEQAIPATAHAAPPAVAGPLRALADRLAVRVPLPQALRRFSADLADSGTDLVVAALLLNARLRGPGLRDVLSALAVSIREEAEVRRRIAAGRRSTRRSVQIVLVVSGAFMVGLAVFNPAYVTPYGTPFGQLVLVFVFALFGAGVLWIRGLASYRLPGRFLATAPAGASGQPTGGTP